MNAFKTIKQVFFSASKKAYFIIDEQSSLSGDKNF